MSVWISYSGDLSVNFGFSGENLTCISLILLLEVSLSLCNKSLLGSLLHGLLLFSFVLKLLSDLINHLLFESEDIELWLRLLRLSHRNLALGWCRIYLRSLRSGLILRDISARLGLSGRLWLRELLSDHKLLLRSRGDVPQVIRLLVAHLSLIAHTPRCTPANLVNNWTCAEIIKCFFAAKIF